MLTKEHAIADYNFSKGIISPDRLNRRDHRHYLQYAEHVLEVYRQGAGKTRRGLHRAVHKILEKEPDCPSRRIEAFCRLLDDVSIYEGDPFKRAARLRRQVFRQAAPFHPLVQRADRLFDHNEAEVKATIASDLGKPWAEIEGELFADVFEFHRLKDFIGYADGLALLSRYNVAQAQAALYRAVDMTVWARKDFKTIMRYAKLARLLHTIQSDEAKGYRIRFDGPVSMLRYTRRYGVNLAKFLPALIACQDWQMHARIATRRRGRTLALNLVSTDGLKSHFPSLEEFDSSIEKQFAEKWGDGQRDGWSLVREGEILHRGQRVYFPDFVLQHQDGRRIYLEIVGFWTPEYLQEKFATLQEFSDANILVAIAESLVGEVPKLPANAIRFKTSLKLKDVLARLPR